MPYVKYIKIKKIKISSPYKDINDKTSQTVNKVCAKDLMGD